MTVEPSAPTVVLVEPRYGGNLGSVARVMANFGLHDLVLVKPAPKILDDPSLEPMARTAVDLARKARVFESLEAALSKVEIALGFSTRTGKRRTDVLELRPAAERIATEAAGLRVAAVFGREDRGLTTAELDLCHWLVRIPTHPDLTSLNLAQAVGLFAYESHLVRLPRSAEERSPAVATVADLQGLFTHCERVLVAIGFIEEKTPDRMMNQLRRILSRRLPGPRDVRILRGILSKVELALEGKAGVNRPKS